MPTLHVSAQSRDVLFLTLAIGVIFIFGTTQTLPLVQNDFLEASWFVVQTITTTGYGSLDLHFWTPSLKSLSIGLMISGTTMWTLFLSLMAKHLWN